MTELNAETLAPLQRIWANITNSTSEQFARNLDGISQIIAGLEEMGLDGANDITCDLLAPGLTYQDFRQKHTEMLMLQALDLYHGARRLTDDRFLGNINRRQYANMSALLNDALPAYEESVASGGLPDTVDPMRVQEIHGLCALNASGALDAELARLNLECAKDSFRAAYLLDQQQKEAVAKGGTLNYQTMTIALSHTKSALRVLNGLKGVLATSSIPLESDNQGYWTADRVEFDRGAVVGLHDSLLLKTCGIEFKEAVVWQDKGQFVLDFSGGGQGAFVLPIQNILTKLLENKYNMVVPSIFAGMGTTETAFWAAYQRERQAVAADPKNAKRLAPEFKLAA